MTDKSRAYFMVIGGISLTVVSIVGFMTRPQLVMVEVPLALAGLVLRHFGRTVLRRERGAVTDVEA